MPPEVRVLRSVKRSEAEPRNKGQISAWQRRIKARNKQQVKRKAILRGNQRRKAAAHLFLGDDEHDVAWRRARLATVIALQQTRDIVRQVAIDRWVTSRRDATGTTSMRAKRYDMQGNAELKANGELASRGKVSLVPARQPRCTTSSSSFASGAAHRTKRWFAKNQFSNDYPAIRCAGRTGGAGSSCACARRCNSERGVSFEITSWRVKEKQHNRV